MIKEDGDQRVKESAPGAVTDDEMLSQGYLIQARYITRRTIECWIVWVGIKSLSQSSSYLSWQRTVIQWVIPQLLPTHALSDLVEVLTAWATWLVVFLVNVPLMISNSPGYSSALSICDVRMDMYPSSSSLDSASTIVCAHAHYNLLAAATAALATPARIRFPLRGINQKLSPYPCLLTDFQ